jgi:hypothetical protein
LETQFFAWRNVSPIPLAAAGQATGFRAGLAKATVRAGMLLPFLLPGACRFEDMIHSAKAPETTIFNGFFGIHLASSQSPASPPVSARQNSRPLFPAGMWRQAEQK